jgi:hypothetical protein
MDKAPQQTRSEAELLLSAVSEVSKALTGDRLLGVEITGLSIRAPKGYGEEILFVIRGVDDAGTSVVAFHSSFSLVEAIRGLAARLGNGSLRWREDRFL